MTEPGQPDNAVWRRLWAVWLLVLLPITITPACAAPAAPPPAEQEQRLDLLAMDTAISLIAYGDGAEQALLDTEQLIYRCERLFSATDAESEISRINSAGQAQQVDAAVLAQLRLAAEISALSGGAFDLTIYPVMRLWGFDSQPALPAAEDIAAALPLVDYRGVKLDGDSVSVGSGQMLDLGAIAKGYTSQAAADYLRGLGIESALLSLGGNVQLIGARPDGEQWRVAIRDPLAPDSGRYVGIISASDAAVVTSGSDQRFFEQDGKIYHHILDPATGYPAESGLLSVTIVAADGMLADALSTALFVLGWQQGVEYWRQHGGFEFVLVDTDKQVGISAGLRDAFAITENEQEYNYILIE